MTDVPISHSIDKIRLPGSQGTHRPFLSLTGSPLSWSTLMIDIGYMDGTSRETNPIAPSLLSMLAETKSHALFNIVSCLMH